MNLCCLRALIVTTYEAVLHGFGHMNDVNLVHCVLDFVNYKWLVVMLGSCKL